VATIASSGASRKWPRALHCATRASLTAGRAGPGGENIHRNFENGCLEILGHTIQALPSIQRAA
jgi:hypothetical protein